MFLFRFKNLSVRRELELLDYDCGTSCRIIVQISQMLNTLLHLLAYFYKSSITLLKEDQLTTLPKKNLNVEQYPFQLVEIWLPHLLDEARRSVVIKSRVCVSDDVNFSFISEVFLQSEPLALATCLLSFLFLLIIWLRFLNLGHTAVLEHILSIALQNSFSISLLAKEYRKIKSPTYDAARS